MISVIWMYKKELTFRQFYNVVGMQEGFGYVNVMIKGPLSALMFCIWLIHCIEIVKVIKIKLPQYESSQNADSSLFKKRG